MNTETDAKMISRGYKWNMLFKMNTKIDAKMMVLNEYRWSILVKMNTEKTRKWWYYVDIDEHPGQDEYGNKRENGDITLT